MQFRVSQVAPEEGILLFCTDGSWRILYLNESAEKYQFLINKFSFLLHIYEEIGSASQYQILDEAGGIKLRISTLGKVPVLPPTAGKQFGLVWFLCLMAYQPLQVILMPKPFSKNQWYYLTHSWEIKEVHTLPESERNSVTGVRTNVLRFRSPSL